MAYDAAWDLQRAIFAARRAGRIDDVVLFLEHPHTYTIGKGGGETHLLVSEESLAAEGIPVYRIDRGGDITYHGPGQLVGYPVFDLNQHYRDVYRYLRDLEEILIRTVADYGVQAQRIPGLTGVWARDRKIAALGVKMSGWITMHGFALNVDPDLRRFDAIIPCGIAHKAVTSLARLLRRPVDMQDVVDRVVTHIETVFQVHTASVTLNQLQRMLSPDARYMPS